MRRCSSNSAEDVIAMLITSIRAMIKSIHVSHVFFQSLLMISIRSMHLSLAVNEVSQSEQIITIIIIDAIDEKGFAHFSIVFYRLSIRRIFSRLNVKTIHNMFLMENFLFNPDWQGLSD